MAQLTETEQADAYRAVAGETLGLLEHLLRDLRSMGMDQSYEWQQADRLRLDLFTRFCRLGPPD